jgi:hypothetical protein
LTEFQQVVESEQTGVVAVREADIVSIISDRPHMLDRQRPRFLSGKYREQSAFEPTGGG